MAVFFNERFYLTMKSVKGSMKKEHLVKVTVQYKV